MHMRRAASLVVRNNSTALGMPGEIPCRFSLIGYVREGAREWRSLDLKFADISDQLFAVETVEGYFKGFVEATEDSNEIFGRISLCVGLRLCQ